MFDDATLALEKIEPEDKTSKSRNGNSELADERTAAVRVNRMRAEMLLARARGELIEKRLALLQVRTCRARLPTRTGLGRLIPTCASRWKVTLSPIRFSRLKAARRDVARILATSLKSRRDPKSPSSKVFDLSSEFLLRPTRALLQTAEQLVFLAFGVSKIVVGELRVFLLQLSLRLVPSAFECEFVHSHSSFGASVPVAPEMLSGHKRPEWMPPRSIPG
jgi:hypothetical protein